MIGSFDGAEHDVLLSEGTLAARAAGETEHETKSHHHQGIDRLGEGLVVSGRSTLDELPEAIELDAEPTPRPPTAVRARRAVAPGGRPGQQGDRARSSPRPRARAGVESPAQAQGPEPTRRDHILRRSAAVEAIRATAWGVVAAGVAAPLLRKRISAPPLATQTVAFAAPVALCVAVRRSRTRDVAVCALQMWAYLAAYKTPHDDEQAQAARVHIDYPIDVDRVLGLGELPTLRLQRALARVDAGSGAPSWRTLDRVLVWAHWAWFMVPHGSLALHPRAPAASASRARR